MSRKKSVCQYIVDAVIEQIKTGELKPGDRLPNEKDMAEHYDVSRISLREALRVLAARGLVVTRHGDGTFVNTYEPELVAETLYGFSLLDDTPLLEALELRKIMESEAARLCCQNATEEEIAEIRLYKDARERHYGQLSENGMPDLQYDYDTKFHLAIARATHNELFSRFIESMRKTIDMHQREASSTLEAVRNTTYYHNELMKAIEARDGERAADIMYKHIEQVENAIRDNLKSNR